MGIKNNEILISKINEAIDLELEIIDIANKRVTAIRKGTPVNLINEFNETLDKFDKLCKYIIELNSSREKLVKEEIFERLKHNSKLFNELAESLNLDRGKNIFTRTSVIIERSVMKHLYLIQLINMISK